MTDLAVLVPTRSRPQNVAPMIEAWFKTGAWGVAELVFILDADDDRIDDYLAEIGKNLAVQRVIAPEWQPLVPKLNRVARKAAEEYQVVAFMGDDHLPRTELWANRLLTGHMLGRGGMITYGRDGFQDERLPTWWSMHSEVIRKLGRMVPAPVQHLYCDNAVKLLGERAGVLRYDKEILIEHMHPVVGKGKMDAQYERVNRKQQYARDQALFEGWVRDGLTADVSLLMGV